MNKYQIEQVIGDGTFGEVVRARLGEEKVAIKKMKRKFRTWEECMQLSEVKALRKLMHPHIVKMREVIREKEELFLVFDYMECNMYQLMKERTRPFSERQIKHMMQQVLQALAFIHKNGIFHRDCKPENLLISFSGSVGVHNDLNTLYLCKLADFGLAREVRSARNMTEYASTRWYRAPEVLLRSPHYNSPIDLFAIAAIMAELFMLRPLFPGSSESDQIFRICSVIGTPTVNQWPDGHRLAAVLGIRFPQCTAVSLSTVIRNASLDAVKLIEALLAWDPLKRVGAASALCHPFFADSPYSAERPPSESRPLFSTAPAGKPGPPSRDFASPGLASRLAVSSSQNLSPVRPPILATFAALPRPSEFGRGAAPMPFPGLPVKTTPASTGSSASSVARPGYFGAAARNYFM